MNKLVFVLTAIFGFGSSFAQIDESLIITPEKTDYRETSTFAQVVSFIETVKEKSNLVHTEVMFQSTEGKNVPLIVLANPRISIPEEAKASGKTIVYIQGNIHGGDYDSDARNTIDLILFNL